MPKVGSKIPIRPYATDSNTPPRRGRFFTTIKWTFLGCGAMVFGVAGVIGILFAVDYSTYRDRHIDRVPVLPLALHPNTGGPKNLPIAANLVDDDEDAEQHELAKKPHLVILGTGWGSVAILKNLNPGEYHVTVIGPENYFLFTPLLPSATVGTVEMRSLVEPIRRVMSRIRGHFIQGRAVDVDLGERLLEVETTMPDGSKRNIYVPYDKLVVAVGSVSNTHGVPGLEHSYQLKTIPDAQAIRRRIIENLETASMPTTTPEERRRLLSFVVCGGGPTGVEMAAELYDMINEDVISYFPKLLRNEVSVHIIQSRDHILNTYAESISNFAEKRFSRDQIELILNSHVKEIHADKVVYSEKGSDGIHDHELPAGFVLWSTGIAMNPFTSLIASILPNQYHYKALETDSHLRVKGAPLGTVYALGDCSTVETNLLDYLFALVEKCDVDGDGKLSFTEWQRMVHEIRRKFPLAEGHLKEVRHLFDEYDRDHSGKLDLNELVDLFQEVQHKITSLPATAQVADQQGQYLAKKFNNMAKYEDALDTNEIKDDIDDFVAKPFKYTHLGSLAYIGNAAVFDFGKFNFAGGLVAMYLWRSVYFSEQVSLRCRLLLAVDWVKRGIFGRDVSVFSVPEHSHRTGETTDPSSKAQVTK